MSDLNLSKEEKEKIVNERIEQIRKKNELLKKRYEEVQTDKKIFESQKSKDRPVAVEREINYAGKLESDRPNDLWKGRGRGRARPIGDNREDRGVGRQSNNAAYEAWRAERERIDSERLNRQKTTEGNWKREWDQNKIVAEDDKEDRRRSGGEEPYFENRRAPRNQKLGDFIPRQRNGDRISESRSFYRQRPKSGHEEWQSANVRSPQGAKSSQGANGNEEWDTSANQTSPPERKSAERQFEGRRQNRGPGGLRYDRSPQNRGQRFDRSPQNRGQRYERPSENQGQRYDKSPQKGRPDKSTSPRKSEGRIWERSERKEQFDDQAEEEVPEKKKSQRSDLRAKLEAIRAKKAQEGSESQSVPRFDLKSPVRSVEVSGDTLRVVIPNEAVASTPLLPESPSIGPPSLTTTDQPSSLMFEGEFFEDDYIHEHIGDSFEDNSKSWETASDEDEYTDAEEESGRSAVPELEPYKSADSGDTSFISAEGRESQQSIERKYEKFDLICSAKDMMLKTFEMYENAEWEVIEYGDLVGLKSSGPCFAWGAHAEEDIQTLQHFMAAPFLYHYTKEEFVPSGSYPLTTAVEMAIKLSTFNQAFYVENLTVRVDNDDDEIRKFADIVARCFSLSSDIVWSVLKYLPEDYIFAYQNGELVGGLLLTVIGDSSIIYYNSVLPKFRGQNISKALMAEAIKVAKEKGAKQMVLLATPLGEPVYKALGFKYIKEWIRIVVGPLAPAEGDQDTSQVDTEEVVSLESRLQVSSTAGDAETNNPVEESHLSSATETAAAVTQEAEEESKPTDEIELDCSVSSEFVDDETKD